MAKKRKADRKTLPRFRSERFVEDGGRWFFYTREGSLEGPYQDMLEASLRLEKYLSVLDSGLLPEEGKFSLESWAKDTG